MSGEVERAGATDSSMKVGATSHCDINKVLFLTVWLDVDWHCVWTSKKLLFTPRAWSEGHNKDKGYNKGYYCYWRRNYPSVLFRRG